MRLTAWSFYDPQTGLFTGRKFTGLTEYLAANTPTGCAAVEGAYDARSQRVDLQTGAVVDDADLAESNRQRRDREQRRAHASLRIEELERRQLRPMRELQIDPANAEALARLRQIEAQILALRADL